ncbi:MAG TPA: PadR family transcriptional regulator [Candidatus Korarchaeota archaeon]|nr:PadR family transcriptional regulator [Candidatus Korarchaeota archaeon]
MGRRWRWGARGPGLFGLYPILVLLMISKGISHGYEIKRKIEEFTGSPLPEGFVYVTLRRLEASGLVVSAPVPGDPRGKKVYQLTPAGWQVLSMRMAELRAMKGLIDAVLSFYESEQ